MMFRHTVLLSVLLWLVNIGVESYRPLMYDSMASSVRRSQLKAGCIPSPLAETEKCSVLNLWHNQAPGSNALISRSCRRKEHVLFSLLSPVQGISL